MYLKLIIFILFTLINFLKKNQMSLSKKRIIIWTFWGYNTNSGQYNTELGWASSSDPDACKVSSKMPSWVRLNFTLTIKGQKRLEGWIVPLCFFNQPAGLVFIWSISELWAITFSLEGKLPPWQNTDIFLKTGIWGQGKNPDAVQLLTEL